MSNTSLKTGLCPDRVSGEKSASRRLVHSPCQCHIWETCCRRLRLSLSLSLSLSYSSVERAFFLWAGEKERDVGAEEETQGLGSKAGSRDGNTRARERRERILSSSSVARRRRRYCRPQSSLSISLRSLASLTQSVVGYLRSWKK